MVIRSGSNWEILGSHNLDQFDEADDMFEEATMIRMMIFHAGRRPGELRHEDLVREKTLGEIA